METKKLKEGHSTVCVWPGTSLDDSTVKEFEKWFEKEFETSCQHLGEIIDKEGRIDQWFVIRDSDMPKIAIKRIAMGEGRFMWADDFRDNGFHLNYSETDMLMFDYLY